MAFPARPSSPFATPGPSEVVLFDVATGTTTRLGQGELGAFSPDGRRLAWVSEAGLNVYTPKTGRTVSLGVHGVLVGFVDRDHVLVSVSGSDQLVELETGATAPAADARNLIPIERAGRASLFANAPSTSPELRDYVVVTDGASWILPRVLRVVLLDESTAVVAAPASDDPATANLFTVDLGSGAAEPLLSVQLAPRAAAQNAAVLPLSAAARQVAWTTNYCTVSPQVHILDLDTNVVTATNVGDWVQILADGRLALGDGFSVRAIADPNDASWDAVLPADFPLPGDVVWSPDFRFVLTGFSGGHGLACAGT